MSANKANGRGEISHRLKIDRSPVEWVTHRTQEQPTAVSTFYATTRRLGLKVSGAKMKAIGQPGSVALDVSGTTVGIVDIDGVATSVYAQRPTRKTYLTADLSASALSVSVLSTSGWPSEGHLWIDSEVIYYGAVTDGTTFGSLVRGQMGSMAQAHYIATGGTARFPEVTNRPVTLAGGRAFLYEYGQNDNPQGDGTLIWTGFVSREPSLSGGHWSLSIEPLSSILERSINNDLAEPVYPRGISYTGANPFRLSFSVNGNLVSVSLPDSPSDEAYFDNNADFCAALNVKIAASTLDTAADIVIRAVSDGDDSWHLEGVTGAAPQVTYVLPSTEPTIDPVFNGEPSLEPFGPPLLTTPFPATAPLFWNPIGDSIPGAGGVPRGYWGARPGAGADPALVAAFPPTTLYLGGVFDFDNVTQTLISWKSSVSAWESGDARLSLLGTDATNRTITTRNAYADVESPWQGFTSASLPEIKFGRQYVLGGGSLGDFLQELCDLAPNGLNVGAVPPLRTEFFEQVLPSIFSTVTDRVVNSRTYDSFGDFSLMDVVQAECLLAGYSMGLSPTGLIRFWEIRLPVPNDLVATGLAAAGERFVIDSPIVSDGLPQWEPSPYGLKNTAVFSRGYNAIDDSYEVGSVTVRDVAAFGQSPMARVVQVALKSRMSGGNETAAELVLRSSKLFSLLAYPHQRTRVVCDARYFDRGAGDVVYITSPHIPNVNDGTRGVNLMPALVTGREYVTASGNVVLYCYSTSHNVAAYVPEFFVASASNVSGNTWALTVTLDSDTAGQFYAAGYRVRIWRWDSTSAGVVAGVVVSITGDDTITVTFDGSAAALSSDTWVLSYANADDSTGLQSAQLTHAFLAGTGARIDATGGDIGAKEFG